MNFACRCRTTATARRGRATALFGLGLGVGLEDRGFDAVALQELVELGAVAARELRRLRDAALGELEDAREVVALEALARVLERRHLVHLHLYRLLDERLRADLRGAERVG